MTPLTNTVPGPAMCASVGHQVKPPAGPNASAACETT